MVFFYHVRISRIVQTRIDSNSKVNIHETRQEDFKNDEKYNLSFISNKSDDLNSNTKNIDDTLKNSIKRLNFEDSKNHNDNINDKKESVNYGEIYDSLKKKNNYLYIADLSRIIFMIILSLIIYFEFYLDIIVQSGFALFLEVFMLALYLLEYI